MMNVSKDVHRDLASIRGIGFVVDTDMIDPGVHGTAGVANFAQLDLACVCCVLKVRTINGMCQSLSDGVRQTSYPSNCRGLSETE